MQEEICKQKRNKKTEERRREEQKIGEKIRLEGRREVRSLSEGAEEGDLGGWRNGKQHSGKTASEKIFRSDCCISD